MAEDDDNALVQRWQQHGDEKARDRLLRRYQPFLRTEAHRATRSGLDFDDAFQMAAMGFLRALDTYDPAFGASLKTYARSWCRQRMHQGRQHLGPVYRPTHVIDALPRIRRAQRSLRNDGFEPTLEEVAKLTGLPADNVMTFIASGQGTSLDSPIDGNDGDTTFLDRLRDDLETPEDILEAKQRRQLLAKAIETLPPKQAESARLYYIEGMTLEEIGARRGITRQGVHLQIQKVERKLVRCLAS